MQASISSHRVKDSHPGTAIHFVYCLAKEMKNHGLNTTVKRIKQDSGQHVPTPRNAIQLTDTKYNAGRRIKRLPRELQK